MKRCAFAVLLCVFFWATAGLAAERKKGEVALQNFSERLGYSMGITLGNYYSELAQDIDYNALLVGIEDGFRGNTPQLSAEEISAVQKEFGEKMQARQQEKMEKIKAENRKKGEEYLVINKAKKGVITTASGLQYEILQEGTGEHPKATDMVKVNYIGTLIDGTEFDNSFTRGEPAVFGVDQVIPGWTEALQLMDVGSKYRIVIPADLAYGEKGAPPVIQPNSVLIFTVDLLSIEK